MGLDILLDVGNPQMPVLCFPKGADATNDIVAILDAGLVGAPLPASRVTPAKSVLVIDLQEALRPRAFQWPGGNSDSAILLGFPGVSPLKPRAGYVLGLGSTPRPMATPWS